MGICKACTVVKLNYHMNKMKTIHVDGYHWSDKMAPNTWLLVTFWMIGNNTYNDMC